jgi:DNA helicase-2/ATP-dependent DNA helicase PcrA
MMLLTFSRRAAAEMQRRVERITAQALGAKAGAMADGLSWSGTFHAIGARLLREYAHDIGLDGAFTIHDRADSADEFLDEACESSPHWSTCPAES